MFKWSRRPIGFENKCPTFKCSLCNNNSIGIWQCQHCNYSKLMSNMFCQKHAFLAFPTSDIIFAKTEPDRNDLISPCDVDHMLDILALLEGEAHLWTHLTNMITIFLFLIWTFWSYLSFHSITKSWIISIHHSWSCRGETWPVPQTTPCTEWKG